MFWLDCWVNSNKFSTIRMSGKETSVRTQFNRQRWRSKSLLMTENLGQWKNKFCPLPNVESHLAHQMKNKSQEMHGVTETWGQSQVKVAELHDVRLVTNDWSVADREVKVSGLGTRRDLIHQVKTRKVMGHYRLEHLKIWRSTQQVEKKKVTRGAIQEKVRSWVLIHVSH